MHPFVYIAQSGDWFETSGGDGWCFKSFFFFFFFKCVLWTSTPLLLSWRLCILGLSQHPWKGTKSLASDLYLMFPPCVYPPHVYVPSMCSMCMPPLCVCPSRVCMPSPCVCPLRVCMAPPCVCLLCVYVPSVDMSPPCMYVPVPNVCMFPPCVCLLHVDVPFVCTEYIPSVCVCPFHAYVSSMYIFPPCVYPLCVCMSPPYVGPLYVYVTSMCLFPSFVCPVCVYVPFVCISPPCGVSPVQLHIPANVKSRKPGYPKEGRKGGFFLWSAVNEDKKYLKDRIFFLQNSKEAVEWRRSGM